MNLKQLATAISSFAPTLATMLGGPLAGTAVSALEQALGLQKGAGADAITQIVQSGALTPEQLAAVRAADQHHAEVMGQQGIDLQKLADDYDTAFAKIEADDRGSAREMQEKEHSPWPGVLTLITTLAIVAEIAARTAGIQGAQDPVTAQLVGTLQAGWIACLAFWVGTTRQSAVNQKAIADIAKQP
jgi:hypothetical protein